MLFRWEVRARGSLLASELQERLAMLERAVTLRLHDSEQAAVDHQQSESVALLVGSLAEVPSACLKVGSLVIVKVDDDDGRPVICARTLSPLEMRALRTYPELQTNPAKFFDALALAVANMDPSDSLTDADLA